MKTKKFRIFITLSFVFALICGTTIIGIASINDWTYEESFISDDYSYITREAYASEGPLSSSSYTSAYVIKNDDDSYSESLSASTYMSSSGDANFSGGYYYSVSLDGSSSGNGSFRGSVSLGTDRSTYRDNLPEAPDIHAAIDSASAWNNIYGTDADGQSSEAYTHIPF